MLDSRPIGTRLLALAVGAYSILILIIVAWAILSNEAITSYIILTLDCALVVLGILAARAINSLAPNAKWLFLGWLSTLLLIGLLAVHEMSELNDSSAASGLLFGVVVEGALGAAGFRYLSQVSRPAA